MQEYVFNPATWQYLTKDQLDDLRKVEFLLSVFKSKPSGSLDKKELLLSLNHYVEFAMNTRRFNDVAFYERLEQYLIEH